MTKEEQSSHPGGDPVDEKGAGGTLKETEDFAAAFRQGTILLHEGKAGRAIPFLERAYQLSPQDVDAAINLAGAYILNKRFQKAVAILEPLSSRQPERVHVWINLGAAYLGNPVLAGDAEQMRAVAAFRRALELDPVAPSVAYNLGLIYRDRKDTQEAAQWFRQAVKHNPQDRDAWRMLRQMEDNSPESG